MWNTGRRRVNDIIVQVMYSLNNCLGSCQSGPLVKTILLRLNLCLSKSQNYNGKCQKTRSVVCGDLTKTRLLFFFLTFTSLVKRQTFA